MLKEKFDRYILIQMGLYLNLLSVILTCLQRLVRGERDGFDIYSNGYKMLGTVGYISAN